MGMVALAKNLGGKYKEAEAMNRQTLVGTEKVLGHEHPDTLTSMNNLATVLNIQGNYEEAEAMHRQMMVRREKVLGPKHPSTLWTVYSLVYLLTLRYRYTESLALYDRASAGYQTVLGKHHPTTCVCHQDHAEVLASQEQAQLVIFPRRTDDSASLHTGKGKGSKVLHGPAKMGIRSSKLSAR
ncbi:hypothetical protein J1614_012214 [Plenodomus biglobosus]|nr:hypothetical protein J1614_012214 [Plenodomus biglobosus]